MVTALPCRGVFRASGSGEKMSRPDVDPYEILGLEHGASWDEIRTAYRRLAKKHHPDKNPGDRASEWIFKDVNRAYEYLRGIGGVQEEAEEQGSAQRGPERNEREPREPQARARPKEPPEQSPKGAAPEDELSREERETTGSDRFKLLRPGWRWRPEDVDWERFRRNPPDWYLAHMRDLLKRRPPHLGWRVLRTAVLVVTFALVGGYLLIILSVLLGPLFGIHL